MGNSRAAKVPEAVGQAASRGLGSPRRLIAVVGFVGSFLAAYFLFITVGSFLGPERGSFSQGVAPEGDDVFTDALIVKGPSNAVRVSDAPGLTPSGADDFIFFVWFKLRDPLEKEERVYLMGKYAPDSRERLGYGLALVGGIDGVRPQVYWQGDAGPGNWHTFAAAKLKPQQWYLLAISFREKRFLGVHLATLGNESAPAVLGGFSVEGTGVPKTDADLVVGTFGSNYFQGRIGPFGIIQSKHFSDDVSGFVRAMADDPTSLPSTARAEDVALWASPRKDRGPNAFPILNARTNSEVRAKRAEK